MQFKDVIGQAEVKTHLEEMISANRLSHALLFTGKEGAGALPMAIAFSQYVLCERRRAAGNVIPVKKQAIYGSSRYSFLISCYSKKAGDKPVSTDYISEWREFIGQTPYGNAFDWLQSIGAENKQGNITAHECNDIIRKLNLKSFESGYKVLVMWMPEYLGTEGNKLLKLIEEPPADTLFILVAENENLVLPTIISRTQLVRIPPIDDKDIETELIAKAKLTPEQARQNSLGFRR